MKPRPFPNLQFDLFSYCNAGCKFCSYRNMTRPKGKMDWVLFSKLVMEVASWGAPVEIIPQHYGEFFANPEWEKVLQFVEQMLPRCSIVIPTNGSLVGDKQIDALVRTKNLRYVSFSTYAFDPGTYKALMGLPPETLGKIEHAVDRLSKERPDITLQVGGTDDPRFISGEELELFRQKWGTRAAIHPFTWNAHSRQPIKIAVVKQPCIGIFDKMMILWDGRVCFCCFDVDGEIQIGDVTKQSILDVWHGPEARRIRELHLTGRRDEVPLCASCSFVV